MVALDDRLTDRKTHSHPAGLGREHWFEKAIEVGQINSAAGIRNRDTYAIASGGFRFLESMRGSAEFIDSMAFITRFKITCCNWTSLPTTGGSG